jgi:hypothetical protein
MRLTHALAGQRRPRSATPGILRLAGLFGLRALARHRRVRSVTLTRLPDSRPKRPRSLLRPRRSAILLRCGPARASMCGRSRQCRSPMSQPAIGNAIHTSTDRASPKRLSRSVQIALAIRFPSRRRLGVSVNRTQRRSTTATGIIVWRSPIMLSHVRSMPNANWNNSRRQVGMLRHIATLRSSHNGGIRRRRCIGLPGLNNCTTHFWCS